MENAVEKISNVSKPMVHVGARDHVRPPLARSFVPEHVISWERETGYTGNLIDYSDMPEVIVWRGVYRR